MEEEKETKEMKRQRTSGRDKDEERDRLSELPDCVVLYIMKFMVPKYAVRTCVLSKRWKDLWKRLTTLSFLHRDFRRVSNFNKFVSRVLFRRDGSISLLNLHYSAYSTTASKLLNKVMKYAVLHNVQQLTIETKSIPDSVVPLIFSCQSLTLLKLSMNTLELPTSLQLPALKNLHLNNASFTARDNDCAEPFSTCNSLNTLVLRSCFLHKAAKVLCIYNSNISSLNLQDNTFRATNNLQDNTFQHKVVLSTPNLTSLTIIDNLGSSYNQLSFSSTSNLSFLEKGNIHTSPGNIISVIIGWMQLLSNVKILTLSSGILNIILNDLSNHATMRTQPPCSVRLESLKVKMIPHIEMSDEEVNRVVEYLLQNSPLTGVAVING